MGGARTGAHRRQALVDGGLGNNVPADVLVRKGCNFVIAVSVTANRHSSISSAGRTVSKIVPLPTINAIALGEKFSPRTLIVVE